jgi:hypothetical protein
MAGPLFFSLHSFFLAFFLGLLSWLSLLAFLLGLTRPGHRPPSESRREQTSPRTNLSQSKRLLEKTRRDKEITPPFDGVIVHFRVFRPTLAKPRCSFTATDGLRTYSVINSTA